VRVDASTLSAMAWRIATTTRGSAWPKEISARTLKRKRQRYQAGGAEGVVDHRLAPHASLLTVVDEALLFGLLARFRMLGLLVTLGPGRSARSHPSRRRPRRGRSHMITLLVGRMIRSAGCVPGARPVRV
jgi:hypothetical protein